ncbi:hypothetical protein [Runella sp.]|nr:hypothetical protein [Runella sp.]
MAKVGLIFSVFSDRRRGPLTAQNLMAAANRPIETLWHHIKHFRTADAVA